MVRECVGRSNWHTSLFYNEYLTARRYMEFLQNHLENPLEDLPLNTYLQMWFQHDGAPPHYAAEVRAFLNASFPDRRIGHGGPVNWPPKSPDLTIANFCMGLYIK